jgi:hypothetical protein
MDKYLYNQMVYYAGKWHHIIPSKLAQQYKGKYFDQHMPNIFL